MNKLILNGIDAANPLGFMAALGTVLTARRFCPSAAIGWAIHQGAWRPYLQEVMEDQTAFAEALAKALAETSAAPFRIDKKLPFALSIFRQALQEEQHRMTPADRRDADMLAAFGSEVCADKDNDHFQDTLFRMVRSGDSKGQGLPYYADAIREATGVQELHRTLFEVWEYQDQGFSLRWDPVEDQRYALRWKDPSKSKEGTMNGANALALEALALFPAIPQQPDLSTTGLLKNKYKRTFFTWPIWESALTVDIIRSLLAMRELQEETPPRHQLYARGIVEIYRCERIAPNQYYRNFSASVPV